MDQAPQDSPIAETESLRARINELEAELALRRETVGVLAGGIAHEFNNLLTSLLGYTDLARSELPAQSKVQPYLEQVLAAGHRAADLTQQILAYAGKGRIVLKNVSLAELIGQMAPSLCKIVSSKAKLTLELSAATALVEGDVDRLRQVVLNLVANASEALGEQEGKITIRTGMTDAAADLPKGRYVLLEVEDTGQGMDEAIRARVFDPFFTTRFPGRGMGLAAVFGIVRSHCGLVRCHSTPGQGATFQVLLPALETRG